MAKFTKPALSISDQIALLQSRGMQFRDTNEAAHYLRHISYYRLRAYWLPYEDSQNAAGQHKFKPKTSFDEVLALYIFDRELRLLVMDAIERIEVSLRGGWAHHLAVRYGPHGYLDPNIYRDNGRFQKALQGLKEEIDRSKETFIRHYKTKYGDPPLPPVWMVSEVISLGQLSKWIGDLKHRSDRQAVARDYGFDESVLVSVSHHLAVVRNICAHHGRLWNKQFAVTVKIPKKPSPLATAMVPQSAKKLYNTLILISYLIEIVAPGTEWRKRLVQHLLPCTPDQFNDMAFPPDWQNQPFWKI